MKLRNKPFPAQPMSLGSVSVYPRLSLLGSGGAGRKYWKPSTDLGIVVIGRASWHRREAVNRDISHRKESLHVPPDNRLPPGRPRSCMFRHPRNGLFALLVCHMQDMFMPYNASSSRYARICRASHVECPFLDSVEPRLHASVVNAAHVAFAFTKQKILSASPAIRSGGRRLDQEGEDLISSSGDHFVFNFSSADSGGQSTRPSKSSQCPARGKRHPRPLLPRSDAASRIRFKGPKTREGRFGLYALVTQRNEVIRCSFDVPGERQRNVGESAIASGHCTRIGASPGSARSGNVANIAND